MSDALEVLDQVGKWKAVGQGRRRRHRDHHLGLLAAPGRQPARRRRQRPMVGSVSGGCIEGAVVKEALDAIKDGKPRLLDFGVTDEQAWDVGLACGGKVQVFVEKVN